MILQPYVISLVILSSWCLVNGYRQLNFANRDVCRENGETSTINTGDGALILSLTNQSFNSSGEERIVCNILVKAKLGFGLLLHAEEFKLRTNPSGSCNDTIEFGREDDIPLYTRIKSGEICGEKENVSYEDPNGQLLIWLQLGPSRAPGPALSLVITPYSKRKQHQFCECMGGPWPVGQWPENHGQLSKYKEQWIRCVYFCDRRVNCALDTTPADEADVSCQEQEGEATPRTGGGLIHGGSVMVAGGSTTVVRESKDETQFSQLSLFTMIILGLLGLSLIACGILCTLKRCGPPPNRGPNSVENPNCPDNALSMIELVRMPPVIEENIYCPAPHLSVHTLPTTAIEAPPPSYTDIFPPDYVPPGLRDRGQLTASSSGEQLEAGQQLVGREQLLE